jgi:hypothetical protein
MGPNELTGGKLIMSSKNDQQAFVAGNSSDGTAWLQSTLGVLSYDEYMQILDMIVEDMKDDLGRIDKAKFESDMQDIIRNVTKKPKHHRSAVTPESIETPELKLKEISTGKKKTLNIKLEDILKVQMFDDYFVITTHDGFESFIERDIYQVLVNITSADEAIHSMAHRGIQYILFAYAKTTASFQKIIAYASDNGILENNRKTEDESNAQIIKALSDLSGDKKQISPNNVVDLHRPE